ncbi:hypothetical protein MKZ23_31255 [Paenibacillus sp. FSL R5-0876]|uniref:hypothetical protein n=2 Tax=Paenibacillus TaxID=44249 RepID=UPI00096C0189|nr:hypothetical protein [Paenibacillus odorifer]OME30609.1 hypothetical protein BSK63_17090 [Paenibacillus odorifer]
MEGSFFSSEEVIQLQSQFDSMILLKMTHDAGFDICSSPIDFISNYYYDYDSRISVFYECISRIFGGYEIDEGEYEETGGESITLTLPFPQMKELLSLLSPEEESKIIQRINQMMRIDSNYGDREMTGKLSSDGLVIRFLGYAEDNHTFLAQLLKIRNAVQEQIDSKKEKLVQRLRSVLLHKIDQELQSTKIKAEGFKDPLQDQALDVTISSSAVQQDTFLSKKTKNHREADEVA